MKEQLNTAVRMTLLIMVLTGLVYPGLVTSLAALLFPEKANGSLLTVNGKVIGSRLIGQGFPGSGYFQGRPSAAGDGYDAANSGGSNLGPTSRKLVERVSGDIKEFRKANPECSGAIPSDLLAGSASGLDPHISPGSADAQTARIAKARGLPQEEVRQLVRMHTEGRQFGILGEARVNVLLLNLALDERTAPGKAGR
jgi:potassium-transporting ATPase KdpC subunit